MLGFDALYGGNLPQEEVIRRAIEERRLWIRSTPEELNLQYGIRYFVVGHPDVASQLLELDAQLELKGFADPLSLCLKCNCRIVEVSKVTIRNRVPPRVYSTFEQFHTCPQCGRVYWPGSHYQRIWAKLAAWGWEQRHEA